MGLLDIIANKEYFIKPLIFNTNLQLRTSIRLIFHIYAHLPFISTPKRNKLLQFSREINNKSNTHVRNYQNFSVLGEV